jgi:hypothetical protein
VPPLTEARIEKITASIRALCSAPFTFEAEAELRILARDLRLAIQEHVGMAKQLLSEKKAAITSANPSPEQE